MIALREKKIAGGKVSLYLDIYYNQERRYEFLNIHVRTERPLAEDKNKRQLAEEIRIQREHELIVENHNLLDKQKQQADFIAFFDAYIESKTANHNLSTTLCHLNRFVGKQRLPIIQVTTQWLKDFEAFLLKSVSVNSALTYLKNINGALNYLVSKRIIARNPWHAIPSYERLKKRDTKRTAWTIDELQILASTSCRIKEQIKQAYFFACFTGLRWSDVNNLQWSNIVERYFNGKQESFIHFEQQKTASMEYFPLSDQAIDILQERKRQEDKNPYIFPHVKETDTKNKPVQSRVSYALKKWAKAAGFDHNRMRFHTGRHSYATNLLEHTNGDLYTVSQLLGHKSIQTTLLYTQVRDKIKYTAVKTLPRIDMNANSNSLSGEAENTRS
ncbi:MAG TPA: site-specific integrase [Cyclobacteriaceae bacterium]